MTLTSDVTVQARVIHDGAWSALNLATFTIRGSVGDFDNDGEVDQHDISLLCEAMRRGDATSDLTGDDTTDRNDLMFLVQNVLGTSFGDANLDGIFNFHDLVLVLQADEYDDAVVGNSTWSEGDWNCDGEFDVMDVVAALQGGGYVEVE